VTAGRFYGGAAGPARRPSSIEAVALTLATLALIVLVVRNAWIGDDAFITLRTVDNWVNGYGLRWNVTERVQAYTHPLWLFVLSVPYSITREPYYTTIAAGVLVTASAVTVLVTRLSGSAMAGLLALAALVSSRAFVEYSTSGLENPLTHLLLALFFVALVRMRVGPRRVLALSTCAALLLLTRQDAILLVLPALGWALWRERGRRTVTLAAIGFVPVVAWEIFSLAYYGFLVPNTAFAKLSTGIPWDESVEQGLLYMLDAIDADPLTVLAIALALVVAARSSRWHERAMGAGIALSLGYVVWVGGDFMRGRFLTPACFAAVALLALHRWPRLHRWWPVPIAVAAVVLAAAPTTVFREPPLAPRSTAITHTGITDERRFYFQDTGLMRPNPRPLTELPWLYQARTLPALASGTIVWNAIGIVGYYLGPQVHVIDGFALSDPLLARLPTLARWRVGHYLRPLPDGYEDTVRSGRNVIADAKLARYYDRLAVVTRGPIWTWERWKTIWGFQRGAYDDLLSEVGLTRRPAASLAQVRPTGTPYDDPANVQLGERGLSVRFDSPTHGRGLDLSLSANDPYTIELRLNGRRSHRLRVAPQPGASRELRQLVVPIPREVVFDEIRIDGRRGDFRYAVGHVRVMP
jgi:arabinofuranosyltransferase